MSRPDLQRAGIHRKVIDMVGLDISTNGKGSGCSVSHIVSPIFIPSTPDTATIPHIGMFNGYSFLVHRKDTD